MTLLPFTMGRAVIAPAFSPESVREAVESIFEVLPPPAPGGPIPLLQPRAQSGFPSLGSADTDLRVISAVLGALKDRGHVRIRIGDGLSSQRNGPPLNTFSRSRLDRLAHYYGAELLDLSLGPVEEVELPCGPVNVSAYALGGAVITLPTVSADLGLGLAGALAGLLGLVHPTLRPRILKDGGLSLPALAHAISPALVIGDCLTILEGRTPPDDLTPFRFERLIASTDTALFDLLVGRLLGVTPEEMPPVWHAIDEGLIPSSTFVQVEQALSVVRDLKRPLRPYRDSAPKVKRSLRERVTSPRAGPRGLLPWGPQLPLLEAPRRSAAPPPEDTLSDLRRAASLCGSCHRCEEFCPVGLSREEIGQQPPADACISCLYCFLSCPKGALSLSGDPGPLLPALQARKPVLEHI